MYVWFFIHALKTSGTIISSKWRGGIYRDVLVFQKVKKQATELQDTIPMSLSTISIWCTTKMIGIVSCSSVLL